MPGEKYGSTLKPGVGRGTEMPAAPITAVCAGVAFAESDRAAPTCRFTATGSRLPPMRRNAALPPNDVMRLGPSESDLYVETPAVRVSVPRPSETRPP